MSLLWFGGHIVWQLFPSLQFGSARFSPLRMRGRMTMSSPPSINGRLSSLANAGQTLSPCWLAYITGCLMASPLHANGVWIRAINRERLSWPYSLCCSLLLSTWPQSLLAASTFAPSTHYTAGWRRLVSNSHSIRLTSHLHNNFLFWD